MEGTVEEEVCLTSALNLDFKAIYHGNAGKRIWVKLLREKRFVTIYMVQKHRSQRLHENQTEKSKAT